MSSTSDPRKAETVPNFPARLLNDGERVVVSTRTHIKALLVPALLMFLALGLLVWSFTSGLASPSAEVEGGEGGDDIKWLLRLAVRVVAVGALLAALPGLVRWLTTSYTFTSRRFIKRSGLIAKTGRTIPLNRISGVDFEIGVIDRIFGCGTLIVSDASTNGRVLLDDIPRVEQVQLKVAEELHTLASGDRADDGT